MSWPRIQAWFRPTKPIPEPAVLSHTVIHTAPDGTKHVQTLGPEHVVESSDTVIDVPAGTKITIRHVAG